MNFIGCKTSMKIPTRKTEVKKKQFDRTPNQVNEEKLTATRIF